MRTMIFKSLFTVVLAISAGTVFASERGSCKIAVATDNGAGMNGNVAIAADGFVAVQELNLQTPVAKGGLVSTVAWNSAKTCNCSKCRQRSSSSRSHNKGLPGGRRYYNGRYYGNFNNRFYGPQYGYF